MKNVYGRLKKYISQYINKNSNSWDDVEVYFIISTGRTATKFLATYLQENYSTKVLAMHEPTPDLLNTGIKFLRKEITKDGLLNHIKLNRSLQCKEVNKSNPHKIYIESNNNVLTSLNELKNVFPKVKFIHVTRDPLTYVGSSLNKINKGKAEYTMYSETDNRPRITAKDYNGDAYSGAWDAFSQFQKVTWYWNKTNRMILDYKSTNSNITTIKYEDIFFDQNNIGLYKMLDFLGLKKEDSLDKFAINSRVNVSLGKKDLNYDNWSEEEQQFFKNVVSNTAKELNYTLE